MRSRTQETRMTTARYEANYPPRKSHQLATARDSGRTKRRKSLTGVSGEETPPRAPPPALPSRLRLQGDKDHHNEDKRLPPPTESENWEEGSDHIPSMPAHGAEWQEVQTWGVRSDAGQQWEQPSHYATAREQWAKKTRANTPNGRGDIMIKGHTSKTHVPPQDWYHNQTAKEGKSTREGSRHPREWGTTTVASDWQNQDYSRYNDGKESHPMQHKGGPKYRPFKGKEKGRDPSTNENPWEASTWQHRKGPQRCTPKGSEWQPPSQPSHSHPNPPKWK